MIDIHSHVLPGVDDGAKSEMGSLMMLEAAATEGIHTVVATPHYNRNYTIQRPEVLERVQRLQSLVDERELAVRVLPGQEVRVYAELLADVAAGKVLTVADAGKYLLVEFPFGNIPSYAEKLLADLKVAGMTPIIAHPERNKEIAANPGRLYDFVAKGALTQLTASSIAGFSGQKLQGLSQELIAHHLVHTIATDAHNNSIRSYSLKKAYEEIEKSCGERYTQYFKENARLIIEGKEVVSKQPKPMGNRKKSAFSLFKGK
ncbi:MAG: hypothetical protein FWE07_05540 [Turicibacter sp.]|nr:hypothetical protein [Turicibacter sp.]